MIDLSSSAAHGALADDVSRACDPSMDDALREHASALTQTICGNLKDVVVILVGYHTFGGVAFDPLNFLGILLGFAGSVSYAYVKLVR